MSRQRKPQKKVNSDNPDQAQLQRNIDYVESHLESAYLYLKTFEEIKINHLKCNDGRCKEKVSFECKCLAQTTLICENHLIPHLKEDVSKTHSPTVLNPEICNQKWDKVVNYLNEYNTGLKNLKKEMISKVTKHVEKINKDIGFLFRNINEIISKNSQKIIELRSSNQKILENMIQLQSNSIKELTKKFDKIEISRECLNIIQAEISDWNANMTKQDIKEIPPIADKSSSQLLAININPQNLAFSPLEPLFSQPTNDPKFQFNMKDYKKIGKLYSPTSTRNGYKFNTSVWRVKNRKSGAELAMKTYTSNDQALINSFHNEAQIMAYLSRRHPCFLDYYGFAVSQSDEGYKLSILMELCNGTLMDMLSQRAIDGSRLAEEDLENWFKLLLTGFLYLENSKIYHLDIKPQNIFISSSGMLKIADFSVSHIVDNIEDDIERSYCPTGVYPIQGTSGYMAPELQNVLDARSWNPDISLNLKYKRGKADCYSLGLTFLQILTLESVKEFNRLDQITIDHKLMEIRPTWIKNMLKSMLQRDYRGRANFRRAMIFFPDDKTVNWG